VRRWLSNLIEKGSISAERDYAIDEELVKMLKSQNTALLRELNKEKAKTLSIIESCKTAISKLNIDPVKPAKVYNSRTNMSLHSLRSDEHVGEKVVPEQVQSIAEYDIDIYKKRLNAWVEKILLFKEEDKENHGLNKLVIARLGDFVTGFHAYKSQSFYVDIPVVDQMMIALEAEVNALLTLCKHFNEVESFAVVGNHGASGARKQHHKKDNWDYVLYHFIKTAMVNQPNFKMYISESPHMLVRHGNYNFFYTHGENMRSTLGLPYYAIDRTFHRINTLYNMRIHYMCTAHHHTPAVIDNKIIMNGSFVGGTDLSINKMSLASLPTQKIFYFEDRHGMNRETDLYLDTPWVLEEDEHGIYTSWK
jgi:hypothetical protein